MSAVFSWGRTREFCDINPCSRIERVKSDKSYEPWPAWALEKLFNEGRAHIVRPALVALYTGQRRDDCLKQFRPSQIENGVWQGKTKTIVPVPLHPVIPAMVDLHKEELRAANRVEPQVPILKTSRGCPWKSGFGASWQTELKRLRLHNVQPSLTYHGFRTTNATLVASAVAKSDTVFGGIDRVKSMLGHLSDRMAAHYARRAVTEQKNGESVLLLPNFGNQNT